MKEILSVINTELNLVLKLNYCFFEYSKSKITYPYLIGDYIEEPFEKECSHSEGTLILTAFTRDRQENEKKIKGTRLELEEIADKIKEHFRYFRRSINKSIVAIEYDYRQPIDSADENIKKIEIYLSVDKWKGV